MSHEHYQPFTSSPLQVPALSPSVAQVVTQLAALVDRTLVRTQACKTLDAECASLQAQVESAQARTRDADRKLSVLTRTRPFTSDRGGLP